MTCQACESFEQRPHSGVYRFQCLECCTRLVLSAYPSKPHAAAMLAAIDQFRKRWCLDAPGRDAILESVSLTLERRRCHGKK